MKGVKSENVIIWIVILGIIIFALSMVIETSPSQEQRNPQITYSTNTESDSQSQSILDDCLERTGGDRTFCLMAAGAAKESVEYCQSHPGGVYRTTIYRNGNPMPYTMEC